MSTYKCTNCNSIIEEDELVNIPECVGECFGTPAYQDDYVCPYCHSDEWTEAEECKCCGEYFDSDELSGGLCDKCIDNSMNDIDTAFAYGSTNYGTLAIHNDLVVATFTEDEIIKILKDYILTNKEKKQEVTDYCNEDRSHFAEWLAGEY